MESLDSGLYALNVMYVIVAALIIKNEETEEEIYPCRSDVYNCVFFSRFFFFCSVFSSTYYVHIML